MAGPKYDTGLARAQRTLLRSAIAAQFADLLASRGGYVRAIRSLPRPLKNGGDEELGWIARAVLGQAPCIVIGLGAKKYESEDVGGDMYRGQIDVSIYVASSNMRGFVDGRLETDVVAAADATRDPGIDTMLEHVEERLLGQQLVLGTVNGVAQRTSFMDPESEDEVHTEGDVTVWEQKYRVWVPREVNPNRAITTLNTSIETDTSIEAGGLGDPQNPAIPPQPPVANLEAP